jgi:hypothetical protein
MGITLVVCSITEKRIQEQSMWNNYVRSNSFRYNKGIELFIPQCMIIFLTIPVFDTFTTNHALIGIKAMTTHKYRIEKMESELHRRRRSIPKYAAETTKRFEALEKSLENIASSLKEGFSGSLQRSVKEIVDKKSRALESLH